MVQISEALGTLAERIPHDAGEQRLGRCVPGMVRAARRRRAAGHAVQIGAGLAVVVGLGSGAVTLTGRAPAQVAAVPAPTPTATVVPDGAPPVELVGLWRVSGVAGQSEDTWLRLEPGQFHLFRDGGYIDGRWDGTSSVLVTEVYGWSPGTTDARSFDRDVPWLAGPIRFEQDPHGWTLLTPDGDPLASLTLDGGPAPIPTAIEELVEPPVVTDETVADLALPGPLPAGLRPATPEDLAGEWVALDGSLGGVEFWPDGTWSSSDGCNGTGGQWTLASDGRLLSTRGGAMTTIGCDAGPVPTWMGYAARAGFDGDVLVLVDRDGVEAGRLTRGEVRTFRELEDASAVG